MAQPGSLAAELRRALINANAGVERAAGCTVYEKTGKCQAVATGYSCACLQGGYTFWGAPAFGLCSQAYNWVRGPDSGAFACRWAAAVSAAQLVACAEPTCLDGR